MGVYKNVNRSKKCLLILFRQICFADFAYSHHCCLSMCAYVCMCVHALPVCSNVCSQVAKILKKITYVDSNVSSRMTQFTFLHLDQGQRFCILLDMRISHKQWEIEQTLLLQLVTKSGIYHRMAPMRMLYIRPWPTFSRLRILKCEYVENCSRLAFIEAEDLPSTGTIANVDLELNIFKVYLSKWLF